jgi:hypothetical protein
MENFSFRSIPNRNVMGCGDSFDTSKRTMTGSCIVMTEGSVRSLADERQTHHPLLGAHVVAVIAAMRHGVAVRALRAMGVDAGQLKAAAEQIANGVRT